MKKAKYGKMRQVNAVNGSKMVVKIRVFYYRQVKGKDVEINWKIYLLPMRIFFACGYSSMHSMYRISKSSV